MVRGIQELKVDAVLQVTTSGVVAFESSHVGGPVLVGTLHQRGYVNVSRMYLKYGSNDLRSSPLTFFHNDSLRTKHSNGPDEVGEQVSRIGVAAVFASKRERLTGWTA